MPTFKRERRSYVDAFGHVCQRVSDLIKGRPDDGDQTISTDDVMKLIEDMGYGAMSQAEWRHLVDFRLLLAAGQAEMLRDCLFQVCNGRVKTSTNTYRDIHALHPTAEHSWSKVFILMETYCADLLSEETGQQKSFKHAGPQAKTAKAPDAKVLKLLTFEPDLLGEVTALRLTMKRKRS